jgi:subtilisin-like proprotein convertase family protein
MKKILLVMMLALTAQFTRADYTFSGSPGGNILTGVGLVSTATASGVVGTVTDIAVELNITGGFNGDLYAYLVAPDQATTAVLLGTVGGNFTQVGSGYNVTLTDTAGVANNIQNAAQSFATALAGTYYAEVSLMSAFGTYLTGNGANGNWRLFIANQSSGDNGQSVLGSWSLTMTTAAVPEPDQVVAMALLGLIGFMAGNWRRWQRVLAARRGGNPV